MPSWFHVGVAYVSLTRLMNSVLVRALAGAPQIAGAEAQDVRERLQQRLVEVCLSDYMKTIAARISCGADPTALQAEVLQLGGLRVNSSGDVSIPIGKAAREIVRFIGHWIHTLLVVLGGIIPLFARWSPLTIVLGVPSDSLFHAGSDARFSDFCRGGPIAPLARATLMLIEVFAPVLSTQKDARHRYCRYPLHTALFRSRLGASGRFKLLLEHLLLIPKVAFAVVRFPLILLLAKDLAQLPAVRSLDRSGALEAVVITNTLLSSQPLWMRGRRRFRVHLVWYSQNAIPLVYRLDELHSNHPHYPLIRADVHWTWTKGFSGYLASILPGVDTRTVGPILWYLPEPTRARSSDAIVITAFDVAPQRSEYVRSQGILEYYYRRENVMAFIEGVMRLVSEIRDSRGRRVNLRFKHKRPFGPFHDREYGRWMEGLETENRFVRVLPGENMFRLIKESDLVVVIPYSSPAYVADFLGVPSIYYDPTAQLLPSFERGARVGFADSVSTLCEQAFKALAECGK